MESVLQPTFFDPLVKHILRISEADNFIEFAIPNNLLVDNDKILTYFNMDAELLFERGNSQVLRGTIKDKEVFFYLIKKYRQL
jgi:nitrogen-specific signal transduction histidine kinase